MLSAFRKRLGAKLFLSYLAVIVVGTLTLASTVELIVPAAFERHLHSMRSSMIGRHMGTFADELEDDLYISFRTAVTQAIGTAALAAGLVAAIASLLVSRRVVAPVRQMMQASQRIAEGRYDERVAVPGNIARGDLDELGELALHFNQMADRLEKTETLRRQLIADVSHELRTPLTSIKGFTEGLIDGVVPPHQEIYLHIHREAERLARLVSDLQELSRIEAGAYELQRQPVLVSKLVESVIFRLERQYQEKEVALQSSIPEGLPPVWVDEDRLGQVLLNLVGNALQYTPAGGQVDIMAAKVGGEIKISIRDSGEGIALEHLPQLFTRFYRADKSRARAAGGSGLGLTIARHLVEAHGGRIWAESLGPGKGSRFTFTLPLAPSQTL
jgi:two-component system, OmpR family, sensor histidine kinase BaeS